MHVLHKNLAGSSKFEFFREQLEHFLEKENLFGKGKGLADKQKLQLFYIFIKKVFSYCSLFYFAPSFKRFY